MDLVWYYADSNPAMSHGQANPGTHLPSSTGAS